MDGWVDTLAAARAVGLRASSIRSMASRGDLERVGTDDRGRAMYRLPDVYRATTSRLSCVLDEDDEWTP
jgi:hypothetical protein